MRSALAAVLTSCALALIGCEKKVTAPLPPPGPASGGTASAPAGGGSGAVTGDTILIGEVGSLTGSEATFGISTRNGIELAINEVNAAGGVKGKKLEVRVYDDQSKPEEAANAVTRLINQDKVLLILGEVASSNSLAMADKAQAAKVPMITPSSTNPKVTRDRRLHLPRLLHRSVPGLRDGEVRPREPEVDQGGDAPGPQERLLHRAGGRLHAQVHRDGREDRRRGDLQQGRHRLPARSSPPSSARSRRRSTSPATTPTSGVIARQARELGINVPLMGGDGWDSRSSSSWAAAAIEGSYFSNHYSPGRPEPPRPEVRRRLQGGLRRGAGRAGGARLRRGEGGGGRDEARAPTLDRAAVRGRHRRRPRTSPG